MINGPTLAATLTTLQNREGLAERLVKARVMGIHFARTRRGETEVILDGLRKRAISDALISRFIWLVCRWGEKIWRAGSQARSSEQGSVDVFGGQVDSPSELKTSRH